MAERIVVVATLQDELSRGLRQIQAEVKATAAGVKTAGTAATNAAATGWQRAGQTMTRLGQGFANMGPRLDSASQKVTQFSKNYNDALDERTTTQSTMAGLALVGAFTAAAYASMRFEKQMSQVQAVSGASADEMGLLKESAMEAGEATQFSATQAAQAQTELAKAGISTSAIMNGALRGSLDLAAAGGIDLARSAEIAATSMNMFGLGANDVTMIADTLAAGANRSAADVEGLAQSLTMVGQSASSTGLTFQDTIATLSMFADQGLKGSDAGTSLKTMLTRLNPTSREAATEMRRLGLDFYDASGQFIGMSEAAGLLQQKLGTVTDERRNASLSTIFGADAVRAANILVKEGAEGWDYYSNSVEDAGAAQRMAAAMTDNLAGDIERLGGAFETSLIKSGSGTNDALRFMVQTATQLVDVFNRIPGPIMTVGAVLTGLAGALLLIGPRVMAAKVAFDQLAVSSPRAAAALSRVGKVAAGLGSLMLVGNMIGQLTGANKAFTANAEDVAVGLANIGSAGGQSMDQLVQGMQGWQTEGFSFVDTVNRITDPGLWDRFNDLGGSVLGVLGIGTGEGSFQRQEALGAIRALDAGLASLASSGNADVAAARFRAMLSASGKSVEELGALMPTYASALQQSASATGNAATGLDLLKAAAEGASSAMADMNAELLTSTAWLEGQNAVMGYKAALDAASASQKQNGQTLSMNTDAGRANRQSLLQIASAARAAYTVTDANGNMTMTNTGAYLKSAQAFYAQARAMGASIPKATALTRHAYGAETALAALGKQKVNPKIEAKTDALKKDISDSRRRLRQLHNQKSNPKVDAKTERLKAHISDAKKRLRQLDNQKTDPKVRADVAQLKAKLNDARSDLRRLEKKPTSPKVRAKIDEAKARIKEVDSNLSRLHGKPTKPTITAQDNATPIINRVTSALDALNGKTVNTYVVTHHSDVKGGDTASSHARSSRLGMAASLGATLGRHHRIASEVGGGFRVTNMLTGGGGRGRGSGDHQSGRAVDVQGPRLGAYVQAVRQAGGFAELHGAGSNRHAHAVLGDTASPRHGSSEGDGDRVSIGPFYFTGVSDRDAASIKATVRAGIREYMQQRNRRGA